jgi:hypothetical protein
MNSSWTCANFENHYIFCESDDCSDEIQECKKCAYVNIKTLQLSSTDCAKGSSDGVRHFVCQKSRYFYSFIKTKNKD